MEPINEQEHEAQVAVFNSMDHNNQRNFLFMAKTRAYNPSNYEKNCTYCAYRQSEIPGIHSLCDEISRKGPDFITKMVDKLAKMGPPTQMNLQELMEAA